MTEFIRTEREDGTIEYVNPRYDELVAATRAHLESVVPVIIPDEEIAADNLRMLRKQRDQKIAETDWWASSDLTMSSERTTYRQALRDITDSATSLDDVTWPTKPA